MGDSAGIGGGVRRREISRKPEPMQPLLFDTLDNHQEPAPRLVPGPSPGSVSAVPLPQSGNKSPQQIPRWLEHAELVLRILLRIYIGLTICYAPWSHALWDHNPIFAHFPTLSIFATNGAVRGIVSGLGLLNLWIALQDIIRHGDK